jgi:DcaP outer membrane protein
MGKVRVRYVIASLCVFVILFNAVPGFAQATPEVQQVQEQLKLVQHQMEELKGQSAMLEQHMEELNGKLAILLKRPGQAAVPVTPPAAEAQKIPVVPLKYIGRETDLRETAGQNETGAPRIDIESIDPSMRGYLRFPGTNTRMKLGGFVKTDFFYDINYAGSYYGAFVPSSFPSTPQPKASNSTVSMRPSRVFVEFRQPTNNSDETSSDVKAYLEWDFLGNYDRTSLRMRQYYAQYKNFLAGQTWSAFGDPDAFPDTLEFEGPPGMVGIRQPQFRYTYPLNFHHSIGVSVEKSGTDTPFSTQFGNPIGLSNRPDIVAFYRYENPKGHLLLSSLFRSVGGVISDTTSPTLKAQRAAYGLSLSNVWELGTTRDNIQLLGIIGTGISNYYNDNFGFGSDVGFSADGKLVTVPSGSVAAGYQHWWSRTYRSTVSYGYLRVNNTAQAPGTNYQISHYATVNLCYSPLFVWMKLHERISSRKLNTGSIGGLPILLLHPSIHELRSETQAAIGIPDDVG